jgi:hypothetical protein
MRKPMLQAGLCAIVAIAGLYAALHGAGMPDAPGVSAAHQAGKPWVFLGLAAAAAGAWFGLRAWVIGRMRADLIDGNDVLARWTVSPAEWAALRGGRMPAGDTSVVIGRDAVVIGDACTPIPAGFNLLTYSQLSVVDWVEGAPGTGGTLLLARAFRAPAVYQRAWIDIIRVPAPDWARGEAQVAIDGLSALINPRNTEVTERFFANELAGARGDPDGTARARARNLLTWGVSAAVAGAIGYYTTVTAHPGSESSSWLSTGTVVMFWAGMVMILLSAFLRR